MTSCFDINYDVVVVGGGNAALSAALSAKQSGAKVLVIEKAPPIERGGNCPFTGGGFRFVHNGTSDLRHIVLDHSILKGNENPYTPEQYRSDMLTKTRGLTDRALLTTLIDQSLPTISWLSELGITFERGSNAQRVGAGAMGSGPGLVKMYYDIARRQGIDIVYETKMVELIQNPMGAVNGVIVRDKDGTQQINAKGIVLACGGFEASSEMRYSYLGPHWKSARVRGSQFNTGDGHRAGMAIGAATTGQWNGYHGTPIDFDAPLSGSVTTVHQLPRRSYNLGIMLNLNGDRFTDEGEQMGSDNFVHIADKILQQPDNLAFQIFDQKVIQLIDTQYLTSTPIISNSIDSLGAKLTMNSIELRNTIREFNSSVQEGNFNSTILDGKCTNNISPKKTNWALKIDTPPFYAYKVTGGITYTFGGLKIDTKAQVLNTNARAIHGLFATGEIVGGFFYHDSLRASGLMHGAVFGRIAGINAARLAGYK
ncbi:MAG: tricarballylate dehydrogenase [Dehalococcoidia bacterium]|nr:tricarballylate dehydrogenase [Dehalococcoidia bacterium]